MIKTGLLWHEALTYCENLEFAGHTDWRLPNVRELQSIVDYGRTRPAIDPVFGAESAGYWSSTASYVYINGANEEWYMAWYVNFVGGYVLNDDPGGFHSLVRAVRSAS